MGSMDFSAVEQRVDTMRMEMEARTGVSSSMFGVSRDDMADAAGRYLADRARLAETRHLHPMFTPPYQRIRGNNPQTVISDNVTTSSARPSAVLHMTREAFRETYGFSPQNDRDLIRAIRPIPLPTFEAISDDVRTTVEQVTDLIRITNPLQRGPQQ